MRKLCGRFGVPRNWDSGAYYDRVFSVYSPQWLHATTEELWDRVSDVECWADGYLVEFPPGSQYNTNKYGGVVRYPDGLFITWRYAKGQVPK